MGLEPHLTFDPHLPSRGRVQITWTNVGVGEGQWGCSNNSYLVKACYFKKVGLVHLSSYGGKIKFGFLVLKIQIVFSRHGTKVHKADFL